MPMWKTRLAIFQGVAGAWLRNIFSSSEVRAERYRQTIAEESFETWMNYGTDFAQVIANKIDDATRRGAHSAVRFWQDVLISAYDFDLHPENRRKRDVMTIRCDEVEDLLVP